MGDSQKLLAFFFLISLTARVSGVVFVVTNACNYTIWPGILSNVGVPLLENGGFVLSSGESKSIHVPEGWSGRLWGRTGCNFTSSGEGICLTGRCDEKLECNGTGGEPPATIVEFSVRGASSNLDFYDVSVVDGYNLPVKVTPKDGTNGSCTVAGCSSDMNLKCPSQLRVIGDEGEVVSCKSACMEFRSPEYCCSGIHANPKTCKPSKYSKAFKVACPKAYSYAFDDPTSLFTCIAPLYTITFCPSSSLRYPPSMAPTPFNIGLFPPPPFNDTSIWNPDVNNANHMHMLSRWTIRRWVLGQIMLWATMAIHWYLR